MSFAEQGRQARLPDATKLWHGGGSTGRPPVCTCNVQSAFCQLLLIKVCRQATGLFLGVETCTCVNVCARLGWGFGRGGGRMYVAVMVGVVG